MDRHRRHASGVEQRRSAATPDRWEENATRRTRPRSDLVSKDRLKPAGSFHDLVHFQRLAFAISLESASASARVHPNPFQSQAIELIAPSTLAMMSSRLSGRIPAMRATSGNAPKPSFRPSPATTKNVHHPALQRKKRHRRVPRTRILGHP